MRCEDCGKSIDSVQNKILEVIIEKQLHASQNNLESAKIWQKTAKFFFFGMVFAFCLSIILAVGYFYFYDFTYEVVEEETVETFESDQDSGDNGTNEVHNINIGGTQWQNNQ